MEITFRDATADDAPLVLEYTKKLAEYVNRLECVTATPDDIREGLLSGRIGAALAEDADGPCGCIVFYEKYSTFRGRAKLYLEDIYVDPGRRGAGVGLALMKRFAQIAIERGCDSLEWQVIEHNKPAMAFYRHLGAKQDGEWLNWAMNGDTMRELAGE